MSSDRLLLWPPSLTSPTYPCWRAQSDCWLVDRFSVCCVEFYELFGFLQGGTGQYRSRRREFEAWLSKENERLLGILRTNEATLSAKELKIRQDTLKVSFCSYSNIYHVILLIALVVVIVWDLLVMKGEVQSVHNKLFMSIMLMAVTFIFQQMDPRLLLNDHLQKQPVCRIIARVFSTTKQSLVSSHIGSVWQLTGDLTLKLENPPQWITSFTYLPLALKVLVNARDAHKSLSLSLKSNLKCLMVVMSVHVLHASWSS